MTIEHFQATGFTKRYDAENVHTRTLAKYQRLDFTREPTKYKYSFWSELEEKSTQVYTTIYNGSYSFT